MREILLNLLSNAQKYTPSGGTVSLTLKELPSDRDGYAVYQTIVEDTGIGMSEQFLPHLFEEFTREYTSTVSRTSGTGLGMPIVKKLTELMGGTIQVESELGKGTKFVLTLSHRIAQTNAEKRGEACTEEYQSGAFCNKRILLAEDNDLNAEIAITILEEEGFAVERAADGVICVDMLEKAPSDHYDLILMDVQMPNMDGYKATRIIRRLAEPQKANIPIVAMTANAFEEDKKNAFAAGMNGHIAKPLQIERFKTTIGQVLAHSDVDIDTYQMWRERISATALFRQFESEYLQKGIPCGWLIYEASGDERILYADKTLVNMFGCSSFLDFEVYVGQSFKTMVHELDIARVEREIASQFNHSENDTDRVKYRIVRKDGAVRYVDDIGRKSYAENGVPVFVVCLVDITDQQ